MFAQKNDGSDRRKKVTFSQNCDQTITSQAEDITRFNSGISKDKKVTFSENDNQTIPTNIGYTNMNESLCCAKLVELKFVPPDICYYEFNAMLDVWFVILMDEINVFIRQCQETNLRDQLMIINEIFITNIYYYVQHLIGQENWLEMILQKIDCYLLNIENILNYLDKSNYCYSKSYYCIDRRRSRVYENLIKISMNILELEHNAKEIQCYLNEIIKTKLLCVPTGILYHIIKLNETTIQNMRNDLFCVEKFSENVERDLRKFEENIRCYCIPKQMF